MTASNLLELSISVPERAAGETSTSMESFSRVGQSTRTTSGSRQTSRDSRFISYDFTLGQSGIKGTKVMGLKCRTHVVIVLCAVGINRWLPVACRVKKSKSVE